MEVSLSATTSRKISGQAYFEVGVAHCLLLRAARRMERIEARSRRKSASLPFSLVSSLLSKEDWWTWADYPLQADQR